MARVVCAVLSVLLALTTRVPASGDETEPAWEGVRKVFRERLASSDPKDRRRAFDVLRDRSEAAAFEELLSGYRKVRVEGDNIRNLQEKLERQYEDLLNKLIAAQAKASQGEQSPREIEAFNALEKKLAAQIEEKREGAKQLENDWSRNRAQLDTVTSVASSILTQLSLEDAQAAVRMLRDRLLDGKDPEGAVRWRDTLAAANSEAVVPELLQVLADPTLGSRGHIAALQTLADRAEKQGVEPAILVLKEPPERFQVVGAAMSTLRRLHDRRAIAPLIEFLRREGIGRLREDAWAALISLTGQEHGPYFEPWDTWWKAGEAAFQMPATPFAPPPLATAKRSKTFYGIHTFSDRVLYIVDLSESMNWTPGKRGVAGGDDAKIVRMRQELIGAVGSMDEGACFNVIAFNHEVIPWGGQGVVAADEHSKRKLARWITDITPTGLTNIYDALDTGFRMINQSTGRPAFDTIFFLTDGKPTGGKITDPNLILDSVRDWNSVANAKIHVIGIGQRDDVDEQFLQSLADIGRGKYIQRSD